MDSIMKDAVDPEKKTSLDDKLAIADRGIKFEALKNKLKDEDWGGGFDASD